jgi:hypothetical protein
MMGAPSINYCRNDTAARKSLAARRTTVTKHQGFCRVVEHAREQMTLPCASDANGIVSDILS